MDLDALLPILRKDDDGWQEIAPCWPLVPGVAVFLAQVTGSPEEGRRVTYLLTQNLGPPLPAPDQLLARAMQNVRQGLQVQILQFDDGEAMGLDRRGSGFAGAAVRLTDFHENAVKYFNQPEYLVAIPNPDQVFIVPVNSPLVPTLRELARRTVAAEQIVNMAGVTLLLGPNGIRPDPDGPLPPGPAGPVGKGAGKSFLRRLFGG